MPCAHRHQCRERVQQAQPEAVRERPAGDEGEEVDHQRRAEEGEKKLKAIPEKTLQKRVRLLEHQLAGDHAAQKEGEQAEREVFRAAADLEVDDAKDGGQFQALGGGQERQENGDTHDALTRGRRLPAGVLAFAGSRSFSCLPRRACSP